MTTIAPYYKKTNQGLLKICPSVNSLLEIGCGAGNFMNAYREINKNVYCVGVEKFETAAKKAQSVFDNVIIGDAEDSIVFDKLNRNSFDMLVYGDVLEHFIDPWLALKLHLKHLKKGGFVCACIPNISHWSIISRLLKGNFEYRDAGLLDRTHLRFFTKKTIINLFNNAGLEIDLLIPHSFQTPNTEASIKILAKIFNKTLEDLSPKMFEDWSTFQYLIRAVKAH